MTVKMKGDVMKVVHHEGGKAIVMNAEDNAAQAVSLPDRETLRRVVGGVLWNATNYPRKAQPYLLGTDTAPLTGKVVDAVLAALSTQPAAGEVTTEYHDSVVNEAQRQIHALEAQLQATRQGREVERAMLGNVPAAILAAKAEAWDEGYWQGINGHTGPGNPHRDSGAKAPAPVTPTEDGENAHE